MRGRGPTVVLIPSGEGDCGSFEKVAVALSRDFTVLTFDMPGFSRSSDPPGFANYSMTQAASEVMALVRALDLAPATFYGCSSGGQVALSLVADHSSMVRNVMPIPLIILAAMLAAFATFSGAVSLAQVRHQNAVIDLWAENKPAFGIFVPTENATQASPGTPARGSAPGAP